jgi:hypothetical protein
MGWPTGLNIDASTGTPTDANIAAGRMIVSNNIFAGNNTQFTYTASSSASTGWTTADLTAYINRAGGGNTVLTNTSDVGLVAAFNYDNTIDINPATGSAASTGGDFSNAKISSDFFTRTNFRGAANVGDTWWKGWTRFM